MILPNYKDGSIVNLMSSLQKALGGKPEHGLLKGFDINILKKSKNVIFIAIDGLGYNFLMKQKNSFLAKNSKKKITSVFPSTTAAAITSFLTGDEPKKHAFTGWYVYLKELATISKILRFEPMQGHTPFELEPSLLYTNKPFTKKIKVKSYHVVSRQIVNSGYNSVMSRDTKGFVFSTLNGFFNSIRKAVRYNNKKKFIYGYWGDLDYYSHRHGTKSKVVKDHFNEIDRKVELLVKSLKDTTVILCSDHGFVDLERKKTIEVKKHPKLDECLVMPLSGDSRVAYAYVKPGKVKQFESYMKKLGKTCWLIKSEEAIKKGYFGIGKEGIKLKDRIGDYIIIMKENYIIKDNILGKDITYKKGAHSGVTEDEMYVPLVVFNT